MNKRQCPRCRYYFAFLLPYWFTADRTAAAAAHGRRPLCATLPAGGWGTTGAAHWRGLTFDAELLYAGAMFHDMGLTQRHSSPHERFEVDGANAADDFLRGHGMSQRDIETPMEADSDYSAVVDAWGKHRGIEVSRVVDASIIPDIRSAQ